MTDDQLINAYHVARDDYEAAKAGTGNRVETFTKFLVAERALSALLGRVDLNLERFRTHCSLSKPPVSSGEFGLGLSTDQVPRLVPVSSRQRSA